eukprot:scaffold259835_cov36-Tisochrysis_lutea.AAC.1
MPLYKAGTERPALAKDHIRLARDGAGWHAAEKAQARVTISLALNLPSLGAAEVAMASNKGREVWPVVAYAHAAFARPSPESWSTFSDSTHALSSKRLCAGHAALAKDQTRLASSRGQKSPSLVRAFLDTALKSSGRACEAAANDHINLDRSSGLKSFNWVSASAATRSKSVLDKCRDAVWAQTTLVRSSELSSSRWSQMCLATASNKPGAAQPVRVKAHATLVASCGMSSCSLGAMACAIARKSVGAD